MFRAHSLRFWSLLGITFLGFHVACADDKYIVTNTWGSFGSNSGQFNLPFGLLTDPNLPVAIYVSDALNNRIQKFDDAGNFESIITGRTAAAPNQAGLAQWGGNLFAVDNGVNAIEIFKESDGSEIGVIFPGVTANSGDRLNRPVGAAFDNVGALYVVDQLNYRVEKFDQNSGRLLTKWGGPCKLGWPNGVPLPGGVSNQCTTPAGGSLGDGQFAEPTFIAYAISDSTLQPMLLVVDQGNARIEAFGTDGSFLFQFGSFGSANGQFWDPIGIAVEWHCAPGMTRPACRSLIFVGDDRNGRVQVFDTSGNFITKFGLPAQPGGAIPGTFQTPVGITVPVNFPLDRFIYVADRGTNTVQQFEPMPDDDNDGILNVIDTDPANFSNDFSDGAKNVGTIVDRGGQAMFNFVISKDISNRGSYSGNIRITTDPLGGASPLLIRPCGMQYFFGVSAGSSTLLKCGSATATVEVGRAAVKFIASSGATVVSDLAAGQSLKIDPDASSVTALAGSVLVYINGNPVTLAAGQGVSLPPVAGISITAPANGAKLADFDMKLFVTPSKGHWGHAELAPCIRISPKTTITTDVTISYANSGGTADGAITLKENGAVIGTVSVTAVQGIGTSTIPVTLVAGTHQISGSITLANSGGSSTASTSSNSITVSDAFSVIDALQFNVLGVPNVEYSGELKYEVMEGDKRVTEGALGRSAQSFNSLALAIKSGQTLYLREHIHVKFGGAGDPGISVPATINGRSHTESARIRVYHWGHCPRWRIDEVSSGPCRRLPR